jgi:hypothetical protein
MTTRVLGNKQKRFLDFGSNKNGFLTGEDLFPTGVGGVFLTQENRNVHLGLERQGNTTELTNPGFDPFRNKKFNDIPTIDFSSIDTQGITPTGNLSSSVQDTRSIPSGFDPLTGSLELLPTNRQKAEAAMLGGIVTQKIQPNTPLKNTTAQRPKVKITIGEPGSPLAKAKNWIGSKYENLKQSSAAEQLRTSLKEMRQKWEVLSNFAKGSIAGLGLVGLSNIICGFGGWNYLTSNQEKPLQAAPEIVDKANMVTEWKLEDGNHIPLAKMLGLEGELEFTKDDFNFMCQSGLLIKLDGNKVIVNVSEIKNWVRLGKPRQFSLSRKPTQFVTPNDLENYNAQNSLDPSFGTLSKNFSMEQIKLMVQAQSRQAPEIRK